jgi:NADP-dependent aldehyde dehydrogenase
VADAVTVPAVTEDLVAVADAETGLGTVRLEGELARVAAQLHFYADVAEEGSYLGATLDRARAGVPALGRVRIPLGPVAVFGASNFPFAFGVLGNDTASALAAGCPVVAKGHPAHPRLSRALADRAEGALRDAGAPAGTFALVTGFDAGMHLVDAAQTHAVAFTGSQRGGMALRERALARPVPIPVYAEMGTVNPVVATSAGCADLAALADGFVGSFTAGAGQFCTKPGLLLAPAGLGVADAVAATLGEIRPSGWSLTAPIAAAAEAGVQELVAAGARVHRRVAGPDAGYGVDTVLLTADADALVPGSRLTEECFGPVALVVEYDGASALAGVLAGLQGALAASVMAGADDPELADVLDLLVPLVGRVAVGDWPTGVATAWAQHHGGPWPATSEPSATSVGAAALDRFTRPVTFQSVPDAALPAALRQANPWSLPRRVDGVLEPA